MRSVGVQVSRGRQKRRILVSSRTRKFPLWQNEHVQFPLICHLAVLLIRPTVDPPAQKGHAAQAFFLLLHRN